MFVRKSFVGNALRNILSIVARLLLVRAKPKRRLPKLAHFVFRGKQNRPLPVAQS